MGKKVKNNNFSVVEGLGVEYRKDKSNQKINYSEKVDIFINHIDNALNSLDQELRRILINDFFEVRKDYWYLEYYTRSTYYRLRKEAIAEFLHCLGL